MAPTSLSRTESSLTIEAEVLATSNALDAALVENDADAVAGFMADEWVYVGPSGITTKADVIGWIATGRLAHHTMRAVDPPRVAVHRDMAIVTGRKASTGTWDDTPYSADEWISEVYVRHAGRWICVLSHKSDAHRAAPLPTR